MPKITFKPAQNLKTKRGALNKNYIRYLLQNCDSDPPMIKITTNDQKYVDDENEEELNRLMDDADSSMLQLFERKISQLGIDITKGERYERSKEFKEYMLD